MLRTIQNAYLLPKLISFVSANDGASVTASLGSLLGTYSRPGAGINRLALSQNFHRAPVLMATAGADASLGGYATLGADPTYEQLDPKLLDDGGVAEDGTLHSLCLGWMSSSTDYLLHKQAVKTVFDRPRLLCGKIAGAATPTVSLGKSDFTVALTGATAGDYTITFRVPFNQPPNVVASLSGAAGGLRIQSVTRSTVRIICGSAAGAAAHKTFNLAVLGSDSLVEQHDLLRAVQVTRRKPEIIPIHISVSGGTPTLTIGADYGTISDEGTGEFLVTLQTERAATLIPLLMANNRLHTASEDTEKFTVFCTDDGAVAEDPTDVQGFVLAFDDANEYYQDR